jgi:hypothetical protein
MIITIVIGEKNQLVDLNKPIHRINNAQTIRLIATMEVPNFEGGYDKC